MWVISLKHKIFLKHVHVSETSCKTEEIFWIPLFLDYFLKFGRFPEKQWKKTFFFYCRSHLHHLICLSVFIWIFNLLVKYTRVLWIVSGKPAGNLSHGSIDYFANKHMLQIAYVKRVLIGRFEMN